MILTEKFARSAPIREKLKRKCAGKSKFTARELRVPAHDKSAAAISRYETPDYLGSLKLVCKITAWVLPLLFLHRVAWSSSN